MNGNTDGTRGSRRVWLLTCLVGVALLMTACGSSGSSNPNGSNNLSASSTSTSSTSAQTTKYQKVLAFSHCVRAHGVSSFPDPNVNGAISLSSLSGQGNLNSSQVSSAIQACRHLLPNGGTLNPAQQQKALTALLKFSRCMRAHGVPNFPDPSLVDGKVTLVLKGTGISGSTPHIVTASGTCRSVLPKGIAAS